jgi:Ca-activated chloride channel homolog
MSRKFVPIIVAAVVVLFIVFNGEKKLSDDDVRVSIGHDSDDADDSRESRRERRKKNKAASPQYALDVERANWPPLTESTVDSATAVKPDALNTTNYYIVLDGSGSMKNTRCGGGTTKIDAAIKAMKQFFDRIPADANIGLAAFDRRTISERVPLGVGNRDALRDALDKISAGSDTPLRSSMKIGYEKLTEQARHQLGYGEYHLVVVTDGQPDPENEDPKPIVKEILEQSPVVLHTVGFCIDSDHVLNQPKKTFYASATDPDELEKSLQAVLAEAPVFDATKFN